ncbi:MAG: Uma2 family endonuclease [Nitrospinae bacterium]|nr:Uma2 family endonuclease [Nitrospinota bacterium]MBI3814536.1 Uma2 family endonuclease [Nitrospinota bacterium]
MKAVKTEYIPRYTYNDYAAWEGRWELIDGVPYAMTPSPIIRHQKVCVNIVVHLSRLLKDCGKCKVLNPVDWKIDEETVVQPDVSVVCEDVIEEKYLTNPPKIIFEIASPSTAFKDRNIKYKIYESQGVKYYIIVDTYAKAAEVFQLENNSYKKLKDAQTDVITFDIDKCKVDFDFSVIWE